MVSFQCDGCADTVKKPKLDQHRQKCWSSFTCLDCSTTFQNQEYKRHTSCISEAEKYQGALYKGPSQKGVKQQIPVQSNTVSTVTSQAPIHPSRLKNVAGASGEHRKMPYQNDATLAAHNRKGSGSQPRPNEMTTPASTSRIKLDELPNLKETGAIHTSGNGQSSKSAGKRKRSEVDGDSATEPSKEDAAADENISSAKAKKRIQKNAAKLQDSYREPKSPKSLNDWLEDMSSRGKKRLNQSTLLQSIPVVYADGRWTLQI